MSCNFVSGTVYLLLTPTSTENPEAKSREKNLFAAGESLEFSGKAVVHLAAEGAGESRMRRTGRIQMTADLAREFGFVDDNGIVTGDMRSVGGALALAGWTKTAALVPAFVRFPHFLMHYLSYKF